MTLTNNVLKRTKYLLPSEKINMGGFPVKQALPTQKVQQVDPFLLLHHASIKPLYDRPAKHQGVGPHPHRGFSPVTFVVEGEVHHRDSRGNNQIAKAGEVQWMHAGAGIIHSERPTDSLLNQKGRQEIIQLWVNSPAAKKMLQPEYQYLTKEETPIIYSEDGKISNKLITGDYGGKNGKIKAQSPLLILWGNADKDGTQSLEIPQGYNSALYLIKGNMRIKGHGLIESENLVVFGNEGSHISMSFQDSSQFLLLAGKPIDEKVTQYGPYVMNTQTEVLEAMRDYQMGKMGVLIEEDL